MSTYSRVVEYMTPVFTRANLGFSEDSTRGKYYWLYCMTMPNSFVTTNTNVAVFVNVLVFVLVLVLGATEIDFRNKLSSDDDGRFGDPAPSWVLDPGYVEWLCLWFCALVGTWFGVNHCAKNDDYVRNTERKMPLIAKVHRAAYTFALDISCVAMTVYGVYARSNHVHPHTTAFFAVNIVGALAMHLLTSMHVQIEHAVWVVGAVCVYGLVITPLIYATGHGTAVGIFDWAHPGAAFVGVLIVSILSGVFHTLLCLISALKNSREGATAYETLPEVEIEVLGSGV